MKDPAKRVDRRRLVATAIGGGALGGAWGAGLTVLARGHQPTLFILGNEKWQVVLADHDGSRALLFVGEFTEPTTEIIDRILGVFRQRIDIVAGTALAFEILPNGFFDRRRVSHVIVLPDAESSSDRTRFLPDSGSRQLRFGDFSLSFQAVAPGAWNGSTTDPETWFGMLDCRGIRTVIAPAIDAAVQYGPLDASLIAAPWGNLDSAWSSMSNVAVAVNGSAIEEPIQPAGTGPGRGWLVRTFPQDIATFKFLRSKMELPDWSMKVAENLTQR